MWLTVVCIVFKIACDQASNTTHLLMNVIAKYASELTAVNNNDNNDDAKDEHKTNLNAKLISSSAPPNVGRIGPGSSNPAPIPSNFPYLSQCRFNQGYWKYIGPVDCWARTLIDDGVDCGNIHNAISIGKQLIADGKCAGFTVNYQGLLYPKSKMCNMHIFGEGCWSFINVSQNPDDYIFELGVDYSGNDLPNMPITTSSAEPNTANSISINDVLAELETKQTYNTNFAVFGTTYTGPENADQYSASEFRNASWYKDSTVVPGSYRQHHCQLDQI